MFNISKLLHLNLAQDIVRRGEILDDGMEDEFYLRRLDAGLFVLQLICYIMVEICNAGIQQVQHTEAFFFATHITHCKPNVQKLSFCFSPMNACLLKISVFQSH